MVRHKQTLPGTEGCQKPLEQGTSKVPLQHFHYPGNLREHEQCNTFLMKSNKFNNVMEVADGLV